MEESQLPSQNDFVEVEETKEPFNVTAEVGEKKKEEEVKVVEVEENYAELRVMEQR